MMKRYLVCLLLMMAAIPATSAELGRKLGAIAATHKGKVTVYAKNLASGDTVSIDPDKPVATASVIKLPLMLEAYRQVKAGKLKLTDKLELTRDNQVPGSGVLSMMDPGLKLTLKDTITLMITLSDNTATNMLIDAVGLKPTDDMLAGMGLKNTYLYKKVYKAPEDPQPPDQKQFGLGKTTAEEMAKVLESIYRCDLADRGLCNQMITIMRNQQYRNMVPRYLEVADTSEELSAIADKIGQLDDVRNDVALVYTKKGPIIISIFTYDNADKSWTPENSAEIMMGKMAREIVSAWSPEGLLSKVEDPIAKRK
jgi:beta-lactamase class A